MHRTDLIAIGELAARTGVAVSAIRFYEAKGLVAALRTGGGQRRFLRADIRRVSFVLIAQQLGLSLDEIVAELARLPAGRTPNGADWTRISTALRARIDAQIAALECTRELLDNCIGCGCLSLKKCGLYNREDKAAQRGAGPRYLLGDRAGEVAEVG
ncbi:MAG: redox-sensitive transcriptional activator SoxR [Sphingopyxis sp.]|nr:redox-sensitive transcriptional activator SoxR [Sphingopyxis sp.]